MRQYLKNFYYIFKILKRNKIRSFLTSLGIVIGISSVIIIMSVGAGAQSLIQNQVESMGSDLIGILPGASEEDAPPASIMGINITTLVEADVEAIEDRVPEVIAVNPYVRGIATATWQNKTSDTSFLGVTEAYPIIESTAEVINGSFITAEDAQQVSRVAVLGSHVADDLFNGNTNPVGETIKINKEAFRVIGVMKERGTVAFQDQDDQIFIPILSAQKLMLGINHLSFIRAKVAPEADIDYVIEAIKGVLRDQHNISDAKDDDFSVRSSEEALDTLDSVTTALNYFLGMVAAISLIVGGIGIMNIMLVSVTESTKEIGLRKAVGATRGDISRHFLMQTIALTLAGGIIGILSGVVISLLVAIVANLLGYKWDFVVPFYAVLLALFFTVLVALTFGWYPSKRAAELSPIDALRYE